MPTLRYCVFEPSTAVRGAVLLTPGFAEHVGRWAHVAEYWRSLGHLVAVYDPRGQGLSEGRRGHVARFDDWSRDLLDVLQTLDELPTWSAAGKPVLFGHSMGGLITARTWLQHRLDVRALVLSSPLFGIGLQPAAWRVALGRWMSRVWPTYSDETTISSDKLTHDAERARLLDADPLAIHRVTARWFTEVLEAQQEVLQRAPALSCPVFCLQSQLDFIVSVQATQAVFDRLPNGELHVVEGCYHELHQELDWQRYMKRFADHFDAVYSAGAE